MGWVELGRRVDARPTQVVSGYPVRPARPLPFGASVVPDGITFSVYANAATAMCLVLYRRGEREPMAELPFPPGFRIGGVYAMTVLGLDPEEIEYGYRAEGPYDPARGHRFDPARVLSDPYARSISGGTRWGERDDPDDPYRFRAAVPYDDFDWEGDGPLHHPLADVVVYELHVRGFTRHPSSGVSAPGTFAGLVERIDYLRHLGVTAVELMPVFEFDELDNVRTDPLTGRRLLNAWGYSPAGFFAPKASYAASGPAGLQVDELKNLVKRLHRAGIEVILDVVFNHTAEGNEAGPTISFRGLDNQAYYLLTPDGRYVNFSGTGNTLNCNHPVVRGFVLDCLRYWVSEYHVDGFRFDLASILGRAQDGSLLVNPPLLESLAQDPVLRDTKLIAEAWDAAGLYQVGSFSDYDRWSEWNGRYRDAVRRFVKGDEGTAGELATRLVGSSDLYGWGRPTASVNFVTAHDGFTLADLVAYDGKHNEANGEGNRDGDDGNNSWNCGQEGQTDDPQVLALRARQQRNLLTLLLCSHGVPMLLAGDEVGRSQGGNNNAYCQDGPAWWFDWSLVERNASLLLFVRRLLALRAAHPALRRAGEPADGPAGSGAGSGAGAGAGSGAGEARQPLPFPPVSWHGRWPWTADWSPSSRLVAVLLCARAQDGAADVVYLAANSHWERVRLELPDLPDGMAWHRAVDTGGPWCGAAEPGAEPPLRDPGAVWLGPRSVIVLTGRPARGR